MQQFAIVIGIFVALLSNYVIVRIAGSANNAIIGNIKAWQVMFWVEIIPAVLYGYAAWKLPESPRYLIHKGFIDQAKDVIAKINSEGVDKEVETIQASFKNKKQPKFIDLLEIIDGRERISPILWAGLGLAILQQLVGINVIFYYGTMLWQSVGFGESDAFLTSVISSAVNLVMTVVAILLIDKIGRKPLLLIGSIGMAVTLSTLTACFMSAGADGSLPGAAAVIALIAANLYITFFAATWGPVMWVMLGEMFNNRIRTIAIAICGLAQWFANFVVTWTFPVLTGKDGIGVGPTYAIYSFFAIFSIFFVAKFIKETKGKELEEM
jgi:SP family sugar:H+ symporter-like MFS transporter